MQANHSNSIKIMKPRLIDIFFIPHLFRKALNDEYKMYENQTKVEIIKRHSLLRLILAKFSRGRLIFIAADNNNIVALVIGTYSSDGVGNVTWIYVLPEYRKKNIAIRLLLELEGKFKSNNCHKLSVATEIAQNFYKKIGYKQEAILRNHWWKKDFYLFSKSLS